MAEKRLKQKNKTVPDKEDKKTGKAPKEKPASPPKEKDVRFRQEDTPEERLSRRDRVRVIGGLVLMVVLLAIAAVLWYVEDGFEGDSLSFVTAPRAPTASEEYIFDTSAGQCFSSVGSGFAVATASGLELIDENGQVAASHLMQMETPAIAACSDYAVFYDIGGLNIAVAYFDGTVRELTPAGNIFSASVSSGGYLCVTSECAGYRGLVRVYDPTLEPVYEWYSSSAWIISAEVSPDGSTMGVLSYTAEGSEIRFFSLSSEDPLTSYTETDTLFLDFHWLGTNQLFAYSAEKIEFFGSDGKWSRTEGFDDRFLINCACGSDFVILALSPYRAGTSSTLVSYDASGHELGTAEITSELVSLSCGGGEVLALCPDSVFLFSDSLTERGVLTGLAGFRYGLLRSRGEAILIASGYAEVHTF